MFTRVDCFLVSFLPVFSAATVVCRIVLNITPISRFLLRVCYSVYRMCYGDVQICRRRLFEAQSILSNVAHQDCSLITKRMTHSAMTVYTRTFSIVIFALLATSLVIVDDIQEYALR